MRLRTGFLVAWLAMAAAAAWGADPLFTATFYPIPGSLGDTMFSALAEGPDGKMYMGTCNSKGPAYLVRLDPASGRVERLGDMQSVTGERDPELIPQSKIHTQLAVDRQGRIWFGTHSEEIYSRQGYSRWPKGYSGGFLVRFLPEVGRFDNLGQFFRKTADFPSRIGECGLYYISLALDAPRDRLYLLTGDNVFLVVYDIGTESVVARHPVLQAYPYPENWHRGHANPRDLEVGADGNVYFLSYEGQVMRYVRDGDRLERLDLWAPGSDRQTRNMPYALAIDRSGTRIYGNGARQGNLFELTVAPEPSIRDLGPAFEGQDTRATVVHAIAMGADGNVYYAGDHEVNLFVYNPGKGTKTCLGEITANDRGETQLETAWAACTARDGSLWLGGRCATAIHGDKPRRYLAFARISFRPSSKE